jgi:uncharacterized membrane protein YfcA
MHAWEAGVVLLAGAAAGTVNAVVGSGTLITFPELLALGYPPVVANVSNNVGLVVGGAAGTWGYRRELAGQRRNLVRLLPMSVTGAALGAVLLLLLPAKAFEAIVPVLIALSLVLVVGQPRIARWSARRREARIAAATAAGADPAEEGPGLAAQVGVFLAGVYGGYFGAAQGVLLVGLLGSLLPESLQRVNALKNLLSSFVNGVAAVLFMVLAFGRIDWFVVLLISVGSLHGGLFGASVGRRLPAPVLRVLIVLVGIVAIVRLLWG